MAATAQGPLAGIRVVHLASLGPGVRGKYAQRLKGTTLVALQPEVADAFPTSESVNEALRAVLKAATVARRSTRVNKRTRGVTRGRKK